MNYLSEVEIQTKVHGFYFESAGFRVSVESSQSSLVSGANFIISLQDNITNFENLERKLLSKCIYVKKRNHIVIVLYLIC